MPDRTDAERFWDNVDRRGPDECWHWLRFISPGGYGRATFGGKTHGVHRIAYELLVGPIPEGLVLDHLCHTNDPTCNERDACPHRRCVNPAHLEPVTQAENIRRGNARRPGWKTHCRHGHLLLEENIRVYGGLRRRRCLACKNEQQNRQRREATKARRASRAAGLVASTGDPT